MPALILVLALAGQMPPYTYRVEGVAFGSDDGHINVRVGPRGEISTYVVWAMVTPRTRTVVRGFGTLYPPGWPVAGRRVRVTATSWLAPVGTRTEHADLVEVGGPPDADVLFAYRLESWIADLSRGVPGHPQAGTLPAGWVARLRALGSASYAARHEASGWFGDRVRDGDARPPCGVVLARTLAWGLNSSDAEVRDRCAAVLAGDGGR